MDHGSSLNNTSVAHAKAELLEAWRAVANAKLVEFRRQCWRLAALAQQGTISKSEAIDNLWEIATAHALVRALGPDHVEIIINEPFVALGEAAA
jgi:hypothetical protein